ncbi:hypothetical protein [Kineococcus arenarius]|uniref:hypothetical protein n=1 Tax=Kineococcus sp. SYSU DK007 TaxID=3383128 RepID=UPI003D7EFE1D
MGTKSVMADRLRAAALTALAQGTPDYEAHFSINDSGDEDMYDADGNLVIETASLDEPARDVLLRVRQHGHSVKITAADGKSLLILSVLVSSHPGGSGNSEVPADMTLRDFIAAAERNPEMSWSSGATGFASMLSQRLTVSA